MSQADRIRQYAIDKYIVPARRRSEKTVTIRAGDVHDGLGASRLASCRLRRPWHGDV